MESLLVYFLTVTFLALTSAFLYYQYSFDYWRKKGIKTIPPSVPFGNFSSLFFGNDGLTARSTKLYKEFRLGDVKLGGLYIGATPLLMAVHPDAIKDIMTTNFSHFASHGTVINEKDDPISAHLFNMDGQKWKDMRVKLTPTFTSGKMKMMFQTLLDCGIQLEDYLNDCDHQKMLDIKEVLACYTTDVIGSCAFGLDCNSFKNPDGELRTFGRRIFTPNVRTTIRRYIEFISPYLVKLLNINFMDEDLQKFFLGVVRDMVHHRQVNRVTRNDFMQVLINMEEQAKLEGKEVFTLEQMAAQAFVFFVAGFETSSTTMTFCFYELAYHQDIQDKLRDEINQVISKHDGIFTYDAMMEMKYLDQVINETLRKYPPVSFLTRACTRNYQLPNGPTIEEGIKVFISVLGLHRDDEYFPDPDKFIPDRFSDENKHSILPYTFLPFGEGPRLCIGSRFAMMQSKVGLCLLLRNHKVHPGKDLEYPLEFDENSIVLTSKSTIRLRIETV